MIDWKKIKEDYSLEDFFNIIERNKPNKNYTMNGFLYIKT